MDLKTGALYPSEEAARRAGVPARRRAEVEAIDAEARLVRVTGGPFRGRVYERRHGGLRRRRDLERREG